MNVNEKHYPEPESTIFNRCGFEGRKGAVRRETAKDLLDQTKPRENHT